MALSKAIKALMEREDIGNKELSDNSGIPLRTVNNILSGVTENPTLETVRSIAKALNCTLDEIAEWMKGNNVNTFHSNARRINVYGKIPAGVPLEAVTDIIDWEEIPSSWQGDYLALQVKGDSMEPEYKEGDVIIVKQQPDCESGQDCVVYVNGYDATLKRIVKQQTCIMLQPLNAAYEPKVYDYSDEDGVTILGVVVEMRRKKG